MPELAIPTALSKPELRCLIGLAEGMDVVELGAEYGASTITLALSARSVHSIDWHQGDEHSGYKDTLHEYFYNVSNCRNVVSHIGRFEDVLPMMKRDAFDVAFIDGQHDRVSVTSDFKLVNPLLKKGAKVVFHDYGRFEVKEAVDTLFGKPDAIVDTLAIVRV